MPEPLDSYTATIEANSRIPERRVPRIWDDADMTPSELERILPKPYEYEGVLHPSPNTSTLPSDDGSPMRGVLLAIVAEFVILAIGWTGWHFWPHVIDLTPVQIAVASLGIVGVGTCLAFAAAVIAIWACEHARKH